MTPFHSDRRGAEKRRVRMMPVVIDRRSRHDRRHSRRLSGEGRADTSWLDRIWQQAEFDPLKCANLPLVMVSVCHGIAGSLYAAWEFSTPRSEAVRRRQFHGATYCLVGSDVTGSSDGPEGTHHQEKEFHRAYKLIYREYPEVRGVGQEIDGQVLVNALT